MTRRRGPRGWVGLGLGYLATFAVVLVLNVLIPRAMPGDPLSALLTAGSASHVADPALQEELRRHYGLDLSWDRQLSHHAVSLLHGDLGVSLRYRAPVAELVGQRLPHSLLLVVSSVAVGAVAGIALGGPAARRRGTGFDAAALAVAAIVRGVPTYFLATLAGYLLAVRLGWFPVSGHATPFRSLDPWAATVDTLHHLALPGAVLALYQAIPQFIAMRAATVQQLSAAHLSTARACGLAPGLVWRRYVARPALPSVVSRLGAQCGLAMTGAVLVEAVFAYGGLGSLIVDAIGHRDYPLLQGAFLALTVVVLLSGFLADVAVGGLDPRGEHG